MTSKQINEFVSIILAWINCAAQHSEVLLSQKNNFPILLATGITNRLQYNESF